MPASSFTFPDLWVLLAAVLLGFVAALLLLRSRSRRAVEQASQPWQTELAAAQARLAGRDNDIVGLQQRLEDQVEQTEYWRGSLETLRGEHAALQERASQMSRLSIQLNEAELEVQQSQALTAALRERLVGLQSQLEAERARYQEKLDLLQEARVSLADQFRSLANDILEDKSRRFTQSNRDSMEQLLQPLRERLHEFRGKIEEIHGQDIARHASLQTELAQLKALNQQMTEEAHGLAVALKGQAKKQGNWGELVLENVLERAGLQEGRDYQREVSFQTDDGRRRPDAIIYLPQGKQLIVDAKVSLNAYTRYVNAEDDATRAQALKEHVAAIASRIKELSEKSYFQLPGLNTPELVFMFIPIESAFAEALRADAGLFQRAVESSVLVATPTTLLSSLNIVRQLWRFETQHAHTMELADRAASVYRKLVAFLASMEDVGKALERARDAHSTAMSRLVSGRGNLIQQAKDFERLGVAVQGNLPANLVQRAALELESAAEDNTPAVANVKDASQA